MIGLYTDKSLLSDDHRRMVHPLLFDLCYYEYPHDVVTRNYKLVDEPVQAQALVFPVDYLKISTTQQKESWFRLNQLARIHRLPLHVYTSGDLGKTFDIEYVRVWRNATYRSLKMEGTIILPSFMNDPLGAYFDTISWIDKKDKPQVAFTGFASNSMQESCRYALSFFKQRWNKKDFSPDQPVYYNAARKRHDILKNMEYSDQIITDFIFRSKYRAGAITQDQRKRTTQEFYNNILQSPYTFCMRGAGNFSVRFYESLACGRIPVLLDTDTVLPLEDKINWEKHICWIKKGEDIIDKLVDFHHNLSPEAFIELQKSNRKLYENYLKRHYFLYQLKEQFKA